MTTEAPAHDLAIVLDTAGKPLRLGGAAKWRRAITLRDLQRSTLVGVEIDGVAQGYSRAENVDALRPLFDEFDPLPPETSQILPPVSVAQKPAALPARSYHDDNSRVGVPVSSSPASAAAIPANVIGQRSVRPAHKGLSSTAWFWIGLVSLVVLFAVIRVVGLVQSRAAPIEPPYPITAYASPVREQVATPGVNLRTGPGVEYPKVATALAQSDPLTGYGETTSTDGGRWQYVQTKDGFRGYVNARTLTPASP
jgi:hypothetical protein